MPNETPWSGMYYPATPKYPAHVCIHRELSDTHLILRVLAHELLHHATESECAAHGNAFRRAARDLGLYKSKRESVSWTTPTPSLHRALDQIITTLGTYPS